MSRQIDRTAAAPDWVVVTAPTDRGGDSAAELTAALAALAKRLPDVELRVAVLGGASHTITEALDDAADAGARCVLLVSGQTLTDRKMDAWFRRVVGHWLRERPAGARPQVRFGGSLCDSDGYAVMLEQAIVDGGVPAGETTAPLTSPLWEQVPGFSRHVLVCRGPRCSARGAAETQPELARVLEDRGLGDDDVLVTVTGCLFPCSQAPVVAVYPDDVWYDGLSADRVPRMVDEHLIGGRAVSEWTGRRAPRH